MAANALPRWLAPLALMAVIFFLSAQPNLTTGLGLIDLIGRKLVHAGTYALLFWLWWRALYPATRARTALLGGLGITILYAISDELHQSFVPMRTGTPIDVAIDTAGAGLAAALTWRRRRAQAGEAVTSAREGTSRPAGAESTI